MGGLFFISKIPANHLNWTQMKAIICPQCGGKIDRVTEGRAIADCGYCGAKVLIQKRKHPKFQFCLNSLE